MSAATAILEQARHLGVSLRLAGDRINVKGPKRAVEEIVPVLREHKPELIAALSAASPSTSDVSGHWLILQPPKPLELYFTPPIARGELAERYPDSLLVCLPDTTNPLSSEYQAMLRRLMS